MVNAAQVKQGNSELFLALAWPKQLSSNPKVFAPTTNKQRGENNNNHKSGKEQQPHLTMKQWEHYTVPKRKRKFDSHSWIGENMYADHKSVRRTCTQLSCPEATPLVRCVKEKTRKNPVREDEERVSL